MARKEEILNDLPPKLVAKLLPFQVDGIYKAICKEGRCLIADEMGLGKTLQAITVAYYYRSEWPALIIVPSSLKYSWIEELEKWLPEVQPCEINLVQAGNDVGGFNSTKITLVSYGILSKKTSNLVLEALMNQKFKVVIADESHYIKNFKSVSSKVIVPLVKAANRRILLSGTPALARPIELFPQLEALNTNVFGNFWEYTNRFCGARYEYFGKKRIRKVDGASNLDELQHKLFQTVMIRREKKDVLKQLPPKQRQRILFELKDSPIKKEIFSLFQELKPKLNSMKSSCTKQNSDIGRNLHFEILQSFQNLFKLSGEAKIGPVQDYIKMLCANNDLKFLIFAYHHDMMDGISQTLWDLKIKFIRIDGSTHPSDRQAFVNQFQSDSKTTVAVLSILAAGVGLTFTEAKMVVFAEMYWTPGTMIQCEDRAHRIGQTCSLPVHYLVAKGSMDEWMWSILNRKTGVVSTILDGQRKELDADKGNQDQIDVLSNADAWDPNNCPEPVDLSQMLQSQESSNQKSILHFFQPTGSDNLSSDSDKKSQSKKILVTSILSSDSNKEKGINIGQQKRLSDSNDGTNSEESPCKKIKLSCSSITSSDSKNIPEETDFTKVISPQTKNKPETANKSGVEPKSAQFEFLRKRFRSSNSPIQKPNKKEKEERQTANKKWNCPVCTFLNHKHLNICDMCKIGKREVSSESLHKAPMPNLENKTPSSTECDKRLNEIHTSGACIDLTTSPPHQEATIQTPTSKHKFTFRKTWKNDFEYSPILSKNKGSVSPLDASESSVSEQDTTHEESFFIDFDYNDFNAQTDDSTDFSNVSFGESTNESPVKEPKESLNITGNKSILNESPVKEPKESLNITGNKSILNESPVKEPKESLNITGNKKIINEPPVQEPKESLNISSNKKAINEPPVQKLKESLDVSSNKKIINEPAVEEPKKSLDISEHNMNESINDDEYVNLEETVRYDTLMFCCSQFTSRLHLYDQDKNPLNANFLPQDVEMNNFSELPNFMKHPHNLKLIHKFVREWNNLTETKRRAISKHKMIFRNPIIAYEEVRCDQSSSVQRHLSKETIAQTSLINAMKTQGSVRWISNKRPSNELAVDLDQQKDEKEKAFNITKGIVQALNADGVPLCINCQKPFDDTNINEDSIKKAENAWSTRFCSYSCMDNYLMKTKQGYCREKLFQIEHGICQLCGLNADSLFHEIRSQHDLNKRVKILQSSQLNALTTKQKEAIIRNPSPGMFWEADHIKAVHKGGGQCDIDNFRTLCVLCHKKVTADQMKQRAIEKRKSFASGTREITNFFKMA